MKLIKASKTQGSRSGGIQLQAETVR